MEEMAGSRCYGSLDGEHLAFRRCVYVWEVHGECFFSRFPVLSLFLFHSFSFVCPVSLPGCGKVVKP